MRVSRRRRPRPVDYRLADAELRQAQAPRTFFIPSEEDRRSLQVGEVAKLIFEIVDPASDSPSAERMWVEVTAVADGRYVGALTNEPSVITTVRPGSLIEFGPEHVIALPDDWDLLEKTALVSRRSHVEDLRPGLIYREAPVSETDSGWGALVGDESDDEVSDPDNLLVQRVGFLLDRWPDLRPLFAADPLEGSWEWDDATLCYVETSDA